MNGDGSMKKKHTGLIIAATSICMTALVILNLFVFMSCTSKMKGYVDEKMLEILQTIRINRQNKAFDEGKIAENQANVIFTAIENSDKEADVDKRQELFPHPRRRMPPNPLSWCLQAA